MNISDSSQFRQCTSCQLCGAVCPTEAIKISLNKDGFYRPYIDDSKCINCGLCVQGCYKFDKNIKNSDLTQKKLYAAWATDSRIVEGTTSGGIADVLSRQLLKMGYICVGVRYDIKSNRAVGAVARNEQQIEPFKGSKYIQSYSVDAFREIIKNCKKQKYAVFGLPCQIYAVDRFLRNRGIRHEHILIDLYCHGCPSLNLWGKYVSSIKKKYTGLQISSVNFRSKIWGWGSFYVLLLLLLDPKTGKTKQVYRRIKDPFYQLFFSDLILNDSCSDCALRSTLEYTDIRLGDFWGKSYVDNHKGVSGVTLCSPRGHMVWNAISDKVYSEERPFSSFIPYQSYGRNYLVNSELRTAILDSLANENEGIEDSIKIYRDSLSYKTKAKFALKDLVKLMPQGCISLAKKVMYSLHKSAL